MSTFGGFAPNWYEGQQNKGLGVYIAPGSVNGIPVFNGSIITVPANAVTYIYTDASGNVQTGASVPGGMYGIALVASGTIITGGNTKAGLTGPLGQWSGLTTDPGILSITDIRT